MTKRIFRTGITGILIALCIMIQIRVSLGISDVSLKDAVVIPVTISNNSLTSIKPTPSYTLYKMVDGKKEKIEFNAYATFPRARDVEPGKEGKFTISLNALDNVTPGDYRIYKEFKIYGTKHTVYVDFTINE